MYECTALNRHHTNWYAQANTYAGIASYAYIARMYYHSLNEPLQAAELKRNLETSLHKILVSEARINKTHHSCLMKYQCDREHWQNNIKLKKQSSKEITITTYR